MKFYLVCKKKIWRMMHFHGYFLKSPFAENTRCGDQSFLIKINPSRYKAHPGLEAYYPVFSWKSLLNFNFCSSALYHKYSWGIMIRQDDIHRDPNPCITRFDEIFIILLTCFQLLNWKSSHQKLRMDNGGEY
jgi:hypothetical protein